jgi:gamma-glutamylcyclotransferase (GGCT)/AIG2-like uncharacterized protein YtfP
MSPGEQLPHLVFAYGTLRESEINHRAVKARRWAFIGYGRTREKMSMGGSGNFAYVTPHPELYQIHGEIWAICPHGLAATDEIEGHPHLFQREEMEIHFHEGTIHAWMYLAQGVRDRNRFSFGEWPAAKDAPKIRV